MGVEGDFTSLLRPPMDAVAIEWLDRRFAEKPREEWLKILSDHGVPRGPVGHREEWFRSETVTANHMRIELEHPKLGLIELPGVANHHARSVRISDGRPRTAPANLA
jgi:crotonobetainyl-CoA:carnitine CoA-transferase CaiB-like acyl-CoA transferase